MNDNEIDFVMFVIKFWINGVIVLLIIDMIMIVFVVFV